ncbi:MAG: hypothetical protein ABWY93_18890 [Mycobacterium sp.]
MAEIRGDVAYRGPNLIIHFDLDVHGLSRYAMESRELGETLNRIAGTTKRFAESISPYDARTDDRDDKLGRPHYRNSWSHVPYIERRVGQPPLGKLPRQAQLVINDSPQALIVEFGDGSRGNNPYGHRIFPKLFDFLESYIA